MSEKPDPNEWENRDDMDDPAAEEEWEVHRRLKKLTGPMEPIQIPQETRPKVEGVIEEGDDEEDRDLSELLDGRRGISSW